MCLSAPLHSLSVVDNSSEFLFLTFSVVTSRAVSLYLTKAIKLLLFMFWSPMKVIHWTNPSVLLYRYFLKLIRCIATVRLSIDHLSKCIAFVVAGVVKTLNLNWLFVISDHFSVLSFSFLSGIWDTCMYVCLHCYQLSDTSGIFHNSLGLLGSMDNIPLHVFGCTSFTDCGFSLFYCQSGNSREFD